jgi:extracellular factor (EF) 3-hydroxypalmitic acid methyl ester biosynthesis protein
MSELELLKARLKDLDGAWHNITVSIESRYHLLARNHPFQTREEQHFKEIEISFPGKTVQLGLCVATFINDRCELYLEDDIFDFDSMLHETREINIESHFRSLQLVLSQQKNIKEQFKEFILRINYELHCYKHYFDKIDGLIEKETKADRLRLQMSVVNSSEGHRFNRYMDGVIDEMKVLVKEFSREEHEAHGFYLRKQLRGIIRCSDLMERANLKPLGYAGDYEMMKIVYENGFRGQRIFEKLFFRHSMDKNTPQAVRNRRYLVPEIISQHFKGSSIRPYRVMSVACGPAIELKDLLDKHPNPDDFQFTLLDQDVEALAEATQTVKEIEKKTGKSLAVEYTGDSVRTMIKSRNLPDKHGTFDFIYSMGLFDYLTPLVAKAVLKRLFSLLKPGGTILVGNFHKQSEDRIYMSYWFDWELYYRDEDDFINLLENDTCDSHEILFEETDTQMFLLARKKLNSTSKG